MNRVLCVFVCTRDAVMQWKKQWNSLFVHSCLFLGLLFLCSTSVILVAGKSMLLYSYNIARYCHRNNI